jgi:hypothetical protein
MKNSETLSRNIQELWEKHCKIVSYYPFSRNKWIVVRKCLKKQKHWKPKQQQGKLSSREQKDNVNPTMEEMNMIQMSCCKKCLSKQKK